MSGSAQDADVALRRRPWYSEDRCVATTIAPCTFTDMNILRVADFLSRFESNRQ